MPAGACWAERCRESGVPSELNFEGLLPVSLEAGVENVFFRGVETLAVFVGSLVRPVICTLSGLRRRGGGSGGLVGECMLFDRLGLAEGLLGDSGTSSRVSDSPVAAIAL